MREGFRKSLEEYGELTKDMQRAKQEGDRKKAEQLRHVKEYYVEKNIAKADAEARAGRFAQEEIFALQEKKQEIMAWLKERIAALDAPEYGKDPNQKELVRGKGDRLFMRDGNGKRQEVTLGELAADAVWGEYRELDPLSVPRQTYKRLLVAQARAKLMDFLDAQIVAYETKSGSIEKHRREAFLKLKDTEGERGLDLGKVAERTVRSFLTKLGLENQFDFSVVQADAYQDVVQKMDFILLRKERGRGVRVEGSKEERLGMQVTISESPTVLGVKRDMISKAKRRLRPEDRIKDILLIQLNLKSVIRPAYDEWIAKKKPTGGPDAFLDEKTRKKMFVGVLQGMYKREEIEEMWRCIEEKEREKREAKEK